MIQEVKMFTLICDGCGEELFKNEEISGWNDESYVKELAKYLEWIEHEHNDYCSDCYEYDDDGEIIIKTSNAKNIQ